MFTGLELGDMIREVFQIHQTAPEKPAKAFRKFDGKTPYGVHPTLAAMLLLHEQKLSEEVRVRGALALLCHDIIEDTTAKVPEWCRKVAGHLALELTFGEDENPSELIWDRSGEAKLLKFYDVVCNLMCLGAMPPDRIQYRWKQAQKHLFWVETHYPGLEIIKIAKGLLAV